MPRPQRPAVAACSGPPVAPLLAPGARRACSSGLRGQPVVWRRRMGVFGDVAPSQGLGIQSRCRTHISPWLVACATSRILSKPWRSRPAEARSTLSRSQGISVGSSSALLATSREREPSRGSRHSVDSCERGCRDRSGGCGSGR